MKQIKQLFFCSVFTLLSVSIAFGQNETQKLPINSSTGKITYSEVVAMKDSVSKNELFGRAKTCFVNLFKNSNKVIQNEDKENGIIIGKGNQRFYVKFMGMNSDAGLMEFTLTIATKDGKYKYVITDFYLSEAGHKMEDGKLKGWNQKIWDSVVFQTDAMAKDLIASIKTGMSKPTPKSDNW